LLGGTEIREEINWYIGLACSFARIWMVDLVIYIYVCVRVCVCVCVCVYCSRKLLIYLFRSIAGVSYRRFMPMRCKLICQRIFRTVGDREEGRDLNEKTLAADNGLKQSSMKSVADECEYREVTMFRRNDLVVLHDSALHYFITRIN